MVSPRSDTPNNAVQRATAIRGRMIPHKAGFRQQTRDRKQSLFSMISMSYYEFDERSSYHSSIHSYSQSSLIKTQARRVWMVSPRL
jgi:hypothetical protein